MKPMKILIVDDDEHILYAFREVLKKDNHVYLDAKDGLEALEIIDNQEPDLVFMDITMPKSDGLTTIKKIQEKKYTIPVIIITGQGTMQTAISAMKLGVFQYLTKPLSVKKIREEIKKVEVSIKSPDMNSIEFRTDFTDRHQLVGNSPAMHDVYKLIGSVATTPNHTSVLLIGETGTGKELVARAIHNNSEFAAEPFIAVNCTALPETLLESELFGHERGSFTGALDRKIGMFEHAGQGTIFLDEIGDLSPELQQKLLRVLQEREMERLGGTQLIPVNARFLAATNQNLKKLIKDGYFRKDLYYRLKVVTIDLPPLHKRKDDIPLLANFFLKRYNLRFKKNISGISNKALSLLQSYTYPGNVRELENLIERAVMLTSGNLLLTDAIGEIQQEKSPLPLQLPLISSNFTEARDYIQSVFEKQFVREQLKRHEGNISAAAKASSMSRQNFHRLIEKHKIKLND